MAPGRHDPPGASARVGLPQLTPAWLTQLLGVVTGAGPAPLPAQVVAVRSEPLGVGLGLLGSLRRLRLTWSAPTAGPQGVVVKAPAAGERSRAVAAAFDMYRTEVRFYRELAAGTGVAVPCHHAELDDRTGDFVIVLEDRSGDDALDQLAGCPRPRAVAVVEALADLHARHWDEAGLEGTGWLRRIDDPEVVDRFRAAVRTTWPDVRARFAPELDERVVALGDRLDAVLPAVAATLARPPRTLAHGDARLDNVFFGAGDRVSLCDWQLTDRSRGVRDLAYFLTQSLTPADRARDERPLVDAYLARLAAQGVEGYGAAEAWEDYRAAVVLGFVYAVVAGGGLDQVTARGEGLTRAMLHRSSAALADHECLTAFTPRE